MLLPETNQQDTLTIAERIRTKVQQSVWYVDKLSIACTVSIGVSMCSAGNKSTEQLMREADKALYMAKEGGRNQVKVSQLHLL